MYSETVELADDGNGNLMLPLNDAALAECDWKEGDTVVWTDLGDGRFSLTKPELERKTVKVLVETVAITKRSYFVDVPETNPEWATDTVVCGEADSKLSEYLDELITGHRVVSQEEYKRLIGECDE